MCHLIWLLSRKYGTVWYHPASSKLWYLTVLSFVNFQEKLTGTSFALCACEASFVRLAVCLALSALFASTGTSTLFWTDRWLKGRSIAELAPCLIQTVGPRIQRRRSVRDALDNRRWVRDIKGALTVQVLLEYLYI
jgi:hypothetical protein